MVPLVRVIISLVFPRRKRKKMIRLDEPELELFEDGGDVRIILPKRSVLLRDQRIDLVVPVIKHNYEQIVSYYQSKLGNNMKDGIDHADISYISLSILLHYLSMYNSWRQWYARHRNMDLSFKEEDFSHPPTHDIIFRYFRASYPDSWEEKCCLLLGKSMQELKAYYANRELYYNK